MDSTLARNESSIFGSSDQQNLEHILFIFVDGLGIGKPDADENPCACAGVKFFDNFSSEEYPKKILYDGLVIGLDATLGVKGLPQSATGQTALLTGVNASAHLGRHLNAFPNAKLRDIISKNSILKFFCENGSRAAFINTFRPPFFDYDPYDIINHLSVTSVANLFSGLRFFDLDDLRAERSIYQEFTNQHLRKRGFDVPIFAPEQAGEILAKQAENYEFCLYEYFQTDLVGHSQNLDRALQELFKLQEFLEAVLTHIDETNTLVLLTSDHGNIENLKVRGHTTNLAMTMVWGAKKSNLVNVMSDITDVAPSLQSLWTEGRKAKV